MTDDRWLEVEDDVADAVAHFSSACQIYRTFNFAAPGIEGYAASMAFMHAMQAGHTSFESALVRILTMLGEDRPSGDQWHADLIRRVARPLASRPAILTAEVAKAADETRRFRNVAVRNYAGFDVERAGPAVTAAEKLTVHLPNAIRMFRDTMDPGSSCDETPSSNGP